MKINHTLTIIFIEVWFCMEIFFAWKAIIYYENCIIILKIKISSACNWFGLYFCNHITTKIYAIIHTSWPNFILNWFYISEQLLVHCILWQLILLRCQILLQCLIVILHLKSGNDYYLRGFFNQHFYMFQRPYLIQIYFKLFLWIGVILNVSIHW